MLTTDQIMQIFRNRDTVAFLHMLQKTAKSDSNYLEIVQQLKRIAHENNVKIVVIPEKKCLSKRTPAD